MTKSQVERVEGLGYSRWLPLDLARGMSSSESSYEDMAGDVDESSDSKGWCVLRVLRVAQRAVVGRKEI